MSLAAFSPAFRSGFPGPVRRFAPWLCRALRGLLSGAALGACTAGEALAADLPATADAWIRLIQGAAQHQNFVGTIVYQQRDDVHVSRVMHSYDPATGEQERIVPLDGPPREFLRRGDQVQCFFPALQRVVVERRATAAFPALAEAAPGEISSHYNVHHVASQRVAGVRSEVLELSPRDRLRYGYRLWVEPASGLLLRAQTLAEQGIVMEQVSFTDLHIVPRIDPDEMRPSWATGGWKVEDESPQNTDLQRQGWTVKAPSGFHRLAEVVRRLVGFGTDSPAHAPVAAAGAGAPAPATAPPPPPAPVERTTLHAVFSDGLATVSVFIEPGAAGNGPAEETHRRGSVTAVSRRIGDARITVVGEVPPATAQAIAESVVFTRPAP
jgi:sigma-E factor negative regulatory protein RseB